VVELVAPPALEPPSPPAPAPPADELPPDAPLPPAPLDVAVALVEAESDVVAPPHAKTAPTPAATNLSRHEFTVRTA
jgi:hypothetical protein